MTIKYLKAATNRAELRSLFIKLLKMYHPDNGGDTEICKIINTEYEYLIKILPTVAADTTDTGDKAGTSNDLDKALRDIVEKVINFAGINIEIIGVWIWLDGNTYPYKEQLKEIGFTWSRARKKWHICPYGEFTYRPKGKRLEFDAIRGLYGSETIKSEYKALK